MILIIAHKPKLCIDILQTLCNFDRHGKHVAFPFLVQLSSRLFDVSKCCMQQIVAYVMHQKGNCLVIHLCAWCAQVNKTFPQKSEIEQIFNATRVVLLYDINEKYITSISRMFYFILFYVIFLPISIKKLSIF